MSEINPENKCASLFSNIKYRDDALEYMYKMQMDLQTIVADKQRRYYFRLE